MAPPGSSADAVKRRFPWLPIACLVLSALLAIAGFAMVPVQDAGIARNSSWRQAIEQGQAKPVPVRVAGKYVETRPRGRAGTETTHWIDLDVPGVGRVPTRMAASEWNSLQVGSMYPHPSYVFDGQLFVPDQATVPTRFAWVRTTLPVSGVLAFFGFYGLLRGRRS